MGKEKHLKIINQKSPDLNRCTRKLQSNSGISKITRDFIETSDGRKFFPCQFCNKVFPSKKPRTYHVKKCPAKDYILSVDETCTSPKNCVESDSPQKSNTPSKIEIEKNLKPPIKLTIRRSPGNGATITEFTITNSILVQEKTADEVNKVERYLENNSETPTTNVDTEKELVEAEEEISEEDKDLEDDEDLVPEEEENKDEDEDLVLEEEENKDDDEDLVPEEEESKDDSETKPNSCRECTKEFGSGLELLRHARKCHKYPKVLMAMSEVKKFYTLPNRSECPICHKPLASSFRSAYVKHLNTHTNEMKHSCKVCRRKFRRMDHLRAHEKRHLKE